MNVLLASSLLCSLLLTATFLEPALASSSGIAGAPAPSTGGIPSLDKFCGDKCEVRCSATEIKERCLKYCNLCCQDCKCVPSGTYGNRDECPCYRDKLNNKNKPKCP